MRKYKISPCKQRYFITYYVLLLTLLGCQNQRGTEPTYGGPEESAFVTQAVSYGSLPSSRFPPSGWKDLQWNGTGTWTTIDVTKFGLTPNTSSIDATAKVKAIIGSSTEKRILYFPVGTYYFKSDLEIRTGNIRLIGAGADGANKTVFYISAPSTANAEIAFIGSGLSSYEIDVVGTPVRGAQSITVADASSLTPGKDFVYLYNRGGGSAYGVYLEAQIFRVISVSDNTNTDTVTLDMKLGLNFDDDPKVKELGMIWNVGVEKVEIYRERLASNNNTNNVLFKNVYNGYAKDLESSFSERGHVTAEYAKDIVIERIKAHHAYSYGDGGQGYGIVFSGATTGCRATDNKLWSLRHHIMTTLGANHCVISYNSAEPYYEYPEWKPKDPQGGNDLNLHGYSSHNNLFEGNMGQDVSSDGRADAGRNAYMGLYNTYFRNRLTGSMEVAGPDEVGNLPPEHYTLAGNVANGSTNIDASAVDTYQGANKVSGSIQWGALNSSSSIPSSLYLASKPSFLGSKPWPLFGPEYSNWGIYNTLPAYTRLK